MKVYGARWIFSTVKGKLFTIHSSNDDASAEHQLNFALTRDEHHSQRPLVSIHVLEPFVSE